MVNIIILILPAYFQAIILKNSKNKILFVITDCITEKKTVDRAEFRNIRSVHGFLMSTVAYSIFIGCSKLRTLSSVITLCGVHNNDGLEGDTYLYSKKLKNSS